MTANPKDRHTWRRIPRDAVEEARRRVGLSAPDDDDSPPTRTSWLPSLRLPEIRRNAIKVIEEAPRAPAPQAAQHSAHKHDDFRGVETLPWQPQQPTSELARGPVVRANVMPDAELGAVVAGGVALAETIVNPTFAPASREHVKVGAHGVPSQSGERPVPSVKAALAAIDAAASHRSARLQSASRSVSGPQLISAADVEKYAALPVPEPTPAATGPVLQRVPAPEPAPASLSERSSARHPLRSPSLTAAPDAYAAEQTVVPLLRELPPPLPAAIATVVPAPEPPHVSDTPAAPAPPEPTAQPFRTNVLRARFEERMAEPLPEVTGSGWSVLLVLGTLLALGLGLAYVGHVEQTSIANGVLQVRGGPRPVLALTSGPVSTLEVAPGDGVQQGQVIARIDATDLNAREQRDVAQLALAQTERERIGAAELARLQAEQRALRQKRALLEERARLKNDAVRDRRERMHQVQHAAHAGVATLGDALAVREAERAASEELLLIRQQITETDLQLTDAQKNYQSTLDRLRHEVDSAATSLAETRTLLQTTEIRAPVAGRVESLQVTQGQVVSSGTVLARIVPEGTVTNAVVFAPAKDASFLRAGLDANLEFASLPVSEFGKTAARVTRVSKDVASADEITSALGRALEEPVIRVELELLPSEQLSRVQDKLRSGERLTARLNTRDRRMIALLFEFLRKWYEP